MNVNQEIEDHWAINGDKIKFKDLESASYDMIRGNLVRYAYGRLRNWMDAEDAVQDAYTHLLMYPPTGEGHNFGALYKITLDRAISCILGKDHKSSSILQEEKFIEEDEEGVLDCYPSSDLEPEQAVDISDQINIIMDMSDNLKPKAKAIVRLALIFNYSYKEIEAFTKANVKTIDNTLSYFRQKIRENPQYEDLRW